MQNAKAAIATGILVLINRSGLTAEQIGKVFLAGGFGNNLDVLHAFRIGLLPEEILGKTKVVGNTSGMGSIMCLLQADSMRQAELARQLETYEV